MTITSMNKQERLLCGIYLGFQLLLLPSILLRVNTLLPIPFSEAKLNFVYFLINFLCLGVICHRYLLRSTKALTHCPWQFVLTVAAALAVYHFATLAVGQLIILWMPDFYNVNDSSIFSMAETEYVLTVISTVFLVPVAEEVLYRGLLFGSLHRRSPVIAYLVSIPAFCVIHVMGYIGMYPPRQLLLCLLQYVPAGVILAWSYGRTGTVLTPIIIHAIINATGIFAVR